jgi:hypothetical protein
MCASKSLYAMQDKVAAHDERLNGLTEGLLVCFPSVLTRKLLKGLGGLLVRGPRALLLLIMVSCYFTLDHGVKLRHAGRVDPTWRGAPSCAEP